MNGCRRLYLFQAVDEPGNRLDHDRRLIAVRRMTTVGKAEELEARRVDGLVFD